MLTSSPSHTILKKLRGHGGDFSEKEMKNEKFFSKILVYIMKRDKVTKNIFILYFIVDFFYTKT